MLQSFALLPIFSVHYLCLSNLFDVLSSGGRYQTKCPICILLHATLFSRKMQGHVYVKGKDANVIEKANILYWDVKV